MEGLPERTINRLEKAIEVITKAKLYLDQEGLYGISSNLNIASTMIEAVLHPDKDE